VNFHVGLKIGGAILTSIGCWTHARNHISSACQLYSSAEFHPHRLLRLLPRTNLAYSSGSEKLGSSGGRGSNSASITTLPRSSADCSGEQQLSLRRCDSLRQRNTTCSLSQMFCADNVPWHWKLQGDQLQSRLIGSWRHSRSRTRLHRQLRIGGFQFCYLSGSCWRYRSCRIDGFSRTNRIDWCSRFYRVDQF
jgi:hypothetical protein